MIESLADHDFAQAVAAIDGVRATDTEATLIEKVEMLLEVAVDLQRKPKTPAELHNAITLLDRALALCPPSELLLAARIRVSKASALRAIPGPGIAELLLARAELEGALESLGKAGGSPEEVGVAEMSLGVVLQALAGAHAAKITDAIAAYQRATRVFDRDRYPRDFAILQNNLATAYLSVPVSDERARMREALAVQAFIEALKVVSLVDDPIEYAMLQNNLGNALQYAASGHPIENGLRALQAYDEALKVRNARDTPVQYANTIANKANCLRNLPDEPQPEAPHPDALHPEEVSSEADESSNGRTAAPLENRRRLFEASRLYAEATGIYRQHGEAERAEMVERARSEVLHELGEMHGARMLPASGFGESRI